MNATSMSINPVNPVQPSPAGRQADTAAADESFSQLLSREMAQTRNDAQAEENSDTRAAGSAATDADAPAVARDPAADRAATQPDRETVADTATDPQPAASVPGMPQELLAPPVPPELLAPPPEVLALAVPPEALKPAPGNPGTAAPGQAEEPEPERSATLDGRTRRPPLVPQTGQPGGAAGSGKVAAAQSGKPDLRPATAAAASADAHAGATATAGPPPAARQPDALTSLERPAEPIGSLAMRAIPHPPAEIQTALTGAATPRLAPSVGTTAWNQALGEKIVWMAAGAQQTASLTLNPPNLGPLQIVLQVSNDQATASFFSAQPEVRQALEAAFPRLREMMDEAGIQLGQATVSADTPRQNHGSERQNQTLVRAFGGIDGAAPAELDPLHSAPVRPSTRGLIDTFA